MPQWLNSLKRILGPDDTNPYIPLVEGTDSNGRWRIEDSLCSEAGKKCPADIQIEELANSVSTFNTADVDLLMAMHKAILFIRGNPAGDKKTDGLKIVIYRLVVLRDKSQASSYSALLKKWHAETTGSPA